MKIIPYVLFTVIFSFEYFISRYQFPGFLKWTPELLSGALLVFLILRVASTKIIDLSPKYFVLFFFLGMHISAGIILNNVDEGPVIPGLRYYLKFFPFFLLPAVFIFSEQQFGKQLKFLLVLGLIQVPLTFYQRFFEYAHLYTGDVVSGTLKVSSILSIYLISSIFILLACYLKKRIAGRHALILALFLFVPCTLNETKVSIVLMPVGLFAIILFGAKQLVDQKKIAGILAATSILMVIFITSYDYLYSRGESDPGLVSFLSGDRTTHYLYRGTEFSPDILKRGERGVGSAGITIEEEAPPTRIDWLFAPFSILSSQPEKLFFGLGIGSVSSFMHSDFEGSYSYLAELVGAENTSLSLIIWELGIGGGIIYYIFFFFIFRDARRLSYQEDLSGAMATGWIGVVAVMTIGLAYHNVLAFNAIGYLFFYFSGYIAASAVRQNIVEKSELQKLDTQLGEKYFVTNSSTEINRAL